MTFSVATLSTLGAAQIDSTNTTETEDIYSALAPYSAYSGATTYGKGDRVYSATSHHVYQSLVAANTGNSPLVAANIGTWWSDAGATNEFRPFDQVTTNQCGKSGSNIRYRLICNAATSVVALFNLQGKYATVIHYDSDAALRNLITFSNDFGNAAYATGGGLSAVTSSAAQDALGGANGCAIQEDGSTGTHFRQFPSFSVTSGVTYTASCYVKRIPVFAARDFMLRFPTAAFSGTPTATADLTAGTVANGGTGGTSTITNIGNGWYRVSLTATATATTAMRAGCYCYNGSFSYSGTGFAGLYMFGAQLEAAGSMSGYQWVEDVTRWGDVLYSSSQNISSQFSTNAREAIFTGINADTGDYIDITVGPDITTNVAAVGEIAIGQNYPLGRTLTGYKSSIIDYSRADYDTFGNPTIIRRNFVRQLDVQVNIAPSGIAQTFNFLASARAVPLIFYDDNDVSNGSGQSNLGLLIYGIRGQYDISGTLAPILTLNVKSL